MSVRPESPFKSLHDLRDQCVCAPLGEKKSSYLQFREPRARSMGVPPSHGAEAKQMTAFVLPAIHALTSSINPLAHACPLPHPLPLPLDCCLPLP